MGGWGLWRVGLAPHLRAGAASLGKAVKSGRGSPQKGRALESVRVLVIGAEGSWRWVGREQGHLWGMDGVAGFFLPESHREEGGTCSWGACFGGEAREAGEVLCVGIVSNIRPAVKYCFLSLSFGVGWIWREVRRGSRLVSLSFVYSSLLWEVLLEYYCGRSKN